MPSVNWNRAAAAHLLRRAGFAGSAAEVDDLVKRGLDGSVDYLLNYDQIDNTELENQLKQEFNFDPTNLRSFNRNQVQRFFIFRMAYTKRPLEEKMTLFWHDHFATGFSKVQDYFMYFQNLTLRKFATAKFDDMVLNIARDPAMIIWLDNNTNVRGRPNENFARELMELFTCGPTDVVTGAPNYTEDDVKESARAFTGWTIQRTQFFFNQNQHDFGVKTFRGETGNFNGEDIIANLVKDRATARFMAKKLFEYFVYPNPDVATIEKFADVYIGTDRSIKAFLRALFTSDEFYSDQARFALVKNPVEFAVGAIRQLRATGGLRNVAQSISIQGMDIMDPPDVAGWTNGLGWINTAALLERYNLANDIATNRNSRVAVLINPQTIVPQPVPGSAAETVSFYLDLLGPLEVAPATRQELERYLVLNDAGSVAPFRFDNAFVDKKVRGLVHLIVSLPEYQLN